jgi:hypothetical protein
MKRRPCDKKRWAWEARVRLKYGLTSEDVAILWNLQGGRCPICEKPLAEKVWVIDHDHKTGMVGGLLCGWDNHRIVSMMERGGPKRAVNAIYYLWGVSCPDE